MTDFEPGRNTQPAARRSIGMVDTGTEAPGFTLPNQDGEDVSLDTYRGTYVVLFFYPQASTRGCTIEARGFRDAWSEYADLEVPVLGVSIDPVADLANFAAEENLPFDLLSDVDGSVARTFDVYDTGTHEGETYEIAERSTVLIAPDGTIEKRYEDVDPEGHATTVLADIRSRIDS